MMRILLLAGAAALGAGAAQAQTYHTTQTITGCLNPRAVHALANLNDPRRRNPNWVRFVLWDGYCQQVRPSDEWELVRQEGDLSLIRRDGPNGDPIYLFVRTMRLVKSGEIPSDGTAAQASGPTMLDVPPMPLPEPEGMRHRFFTVRKAATACLDLKAAAAIENPLDPHRSDPDWVKSVEIGGYCQQIPVGYTLSVLAKVNDVSAVETESPKEKSAVLFIRSDLLVPQAEASPSLTELKPAQDYTWATGRDLSPVLAALHRDDPPSPLYHVRTPGTLGCGNPEGLTLARTQGTSFTDEAVEHYHCLSTLPEVNLRIYGKSGDMALADLVPSDAHEPHLYLFYRQSDLVEARPDNKS